MSYLLVRAETFIDRWTSHIPLFSPVMMDNACRVHYVPFFVEFAPEKVSIWRLKHSSFADASVIAVRALAEEIMSEILPAMKNEMELKL